MKYLVIAKLLNLLSSLYQLYFFLTSMHLVWRCLHIGIALRYRFAKLGLFLTFPEENREWEGGGGGFCKLSSSDKVIFDPRTTDFILDNDFWTPETRIYPQSEYIYPLDKDNFDVFSLSPGHLRTFPGAGSGLPSCENRKEWKIINFYFFRPPWQHS